MEEQNDRNRRELIEERAFIENILNQRFNFFIIFLSLIANAAIMANKTKYFIPILIFGVIICSLLSLPIIRAQKKLDIYLGEFPNDHPVITVNEKANRGVFGFSARRIIGYAIPLIALIFLIGWLLFEIFMLLGTHGQA